MKRTAIGKIDESIPLAKNQKGSLRWTSFDGSVHFIEQLSEKHLDNVIRFLIKHPKQSTLIWDLIKILATEKAYRITIQSLRKKKEAEKFTLAENFTMEYYDCILNDMPPLNFH